MLYSKNIKTCNKIIVSGNSEYAPLIWRDKKNPKKLIGFAIELIEIAFKEINIPIEGKYVGNWARTQHEVKRGKVDILGGAYITKERQKFMDYIIPQFIMDPSVIFVHKDESFTYNRWEDLVGKTGGAPLGNSFGSEFDKFEKKNLQIERVSLLSQAFKKLLIKRNDYVIYGLYPGLAELEILGFQDKLTYLKKSVIEEGLYFTLSKKSPCNSKEIKSHLSKKVIEFTKQGLPDKLLKKYLKIWKEQNS